MRTLKVLQCNINGLTTLATRVKLDQLLKMADLNNVQVIALQETKLKLNTSLKYRGYKIYRKDRLTRGGGGLAFFIRDVNYQSIDCAGDLDSDLEIQGIKLKWRGKPLHIFNVYHPPNQKPMPTSFLNILDKNTIILGDLNAKHVIWGCSSNNNRGLDISQLADDNEFIFLNDGTHTHTSFSYNSSEALDIAMTSAEIFPQCSWSVMDNIGSDHLPILIEFKKKQKIYHNRDYFWNFNKANWSSFRDSVDRELAAALFNDDLNSNWLTFKNTILKHARAYIPRGNEKGYVPCYTQNLSILDPLIEKRKNLVDSAGHAENNPRPELNKINAEIKSAYAHLRRSRWNELCSTIDARTPNSKLWKLVKGISREQPQIDKCSSIFDANGQMFPDDKSAANGLAIHYQKISKLTLTNEDKPILYNARNIVHGCRSTDLGDPSMVKNFSLRELLLAMTHLDLGRSPGPDGLHGFMLENLGGIGKQRLIDIINLSWKKGCLPQEWKRAIIIPIKKPNKSTCSPGDFRPITLTCTASKIMEKMILMRLQFFLDRHNLLPSEQFGFRRGHSTTDQVLYFAQTIRDAQNLKPTHHSVAALLDLTKAFDRVWKHKLIIKLHDIFRVRGNALAWISDYLHQRSIRVKFNRTFSDTFLLSQGVPQGTVLSPTLFSLYLAGLEKVISPGTSIGMFADDIALWSSGTNIAQLEASINDSLKALSVFAAEFKLCFNPAKSIATFFTTDKHLYNYQPLLKLDHQDLTYEKHPKYLGYILDPEFTGNKHIEHITLKAKKRLNILKYIAGRDWGANASTLRNSYLALIRPILEFGFPIFCCASKTNLDKLERVQSSAARIITGLRRSTPSEVALYEANLQPLHSRRQACLVKYYNKLSSYGQSNITSKYLNNWTSSQRLKKNSPFSQVISQHLLADNVEYQSLYGSLGPMEDLSRVHFHSNINAAVNKKDFAPDLLRQLALEIINSIPSGDIKIYTDGSRINDQSGSGIYIETPQNKFSLRQRNPDFCSVFRSELLAIDVGLETILSESGYGDLWLLTDSRSSLQHLSNWTMVGDKTSLSILHKLKSISLQHEIHLQWIPSHVDIFGNELADNLAKEGSGLSTTSSSELTYLELYSQKNSQIRNEWLVPPAHHWYKGSKPGLPLSLTCDRKSCTSLSRLASGHLRCLVFSGGNKSYPTCPKCHQHQASPAHILDCLGLRWEDIYSSPLQVIDFLGVNGFSGLV